MRVEVTRTCAARRASASATRRCRTPGAEVEDALVLEQLAVADVEQLVVDQQPDELAVGDAEDASRPPRGCRRPLSAYGSGRISWKPLRYVPGSPFGLALVEVAAQADVAVGQREQRLALGEERRG